MKFKCVYLNLSFINIKMLLILHLFHYHLIVVNILHIYQLTVDGMKITHPNSIADSLGSYFASVGDKFAQKIPTPKTDANEYISKIHETSNSMYF